MISSWMGELFICESVWEVNQNRGQVVREAAFKVTSLALDL